MSTNSLSDIVDCRSFEDFPVQGETDKVYLNRQDNSIYRWTPKGVYVAVMHEFYESISDETLEKIRDLFDISTDKLETLKKAFSNQEILMLYVSLRTALQSHILQPF